MRTFKRILKKLLYPHGVLVFFLTVLSGTGLCYVFLNGMESDPIAYAVYPLSFYALCLLIAALVPLIRKGRYMVYGNAHAARYLTQQELRARISLYCGTAVNLAYAVFKLTSGIYYRSVWFGAVAVYYMVLCVIRFLLVQNDRRIRRLDDKREGRLRQWSSYRTCGWLLLLLNATMTGMMVQMIWQNKSYTYPGFVIYAAAAYTFYRLTMAIIRTVKIQRANNPILAAAKAIDLSVALMAIFSLQTAMFASFGTDIGDHMRMMNAMTSGAVCTVVVCMAVFMLVRSGRALKAAQINKIET